MNNKIKIAWHGLHFGEEPPLVGSANHPHTPPSEGGEKFGAGTIFFSGCNLHCVFCQNWQISQEDLGKNYSVEDLAGMMLDLQKQGAANIDLVTPTPWRREIKQAIISAKNNGLEIPIAWNSNAYESVAAIKDLEGLVDIYLPDFKYGNNLTAAKYSRALSYAEVAEKAIREMYRQAGLLKVDKNGLAQKGLIVRHLILPNNLPNTFSVLEKIALIDENIHLSLMSQFYPVYRAKEFPELNRPVSAEEIAAAEKRKFEFGLENGWTQEPEAGEIFLPDFNNLNPFVK